MAVIRVEKNRNFTTMSNVHLRDTNLSLKAKGLLSICLSLPDNWDYSVNGLTAICKEGRDAVLTTLQELERLGYVFREQTRTPDGRMGKSAYVIYESPKENPRLGVPQTEKPTTAKPITVQPQTVNPGQSNTNQRNTDRNNNGENKVARHKFGQYGNVLLSDEELEKLKTEYPHDFADRIERLSEYMASTGRSYKSHLATIRSWARKETPARIQGYSHDIYRYEEGESL